MYFALSGSSVLKTLRVTMPKLRHAMEELGQTFGVSAFLSQTQDRMSLMFFFLPPSSLFLPLLLSHSLWCHALGVPRR